MNNLSICLICISHSKYLKSKIEHNSSPLCGWKNGWRDTFFQTIFFLFTIDLLIQKVQLTYVHASYIFIEFLMHSNGIDPLLSIVPFCWHAAKKKHFNYTEENLQILNEKIVENNIMHLSASQNVT